MERRKQWSFAITDDGSWAWKVVGPDGGEESSERTFRTLRECTENAAVNGYVVWRTEEERRRLG